MIANLLFKAEAMHKIRRNSIRLYPSMLFTVDDDIGVRLNMQFKFGGICHSEHSCEHYWSQKEHDLGNWIICTTAENFQV